MRLLDFSIASIGLCLLGPFFLVVAVVIKLTSAGPVFYQALRVGQGGRLFRLYKFRTMVLNADHLGPPLTSKDDQRITSVGSLLRQTKIDELPQLLNVIKGDMNLVGPRAEDPKYLVSYTDRQRQVLAVKPGITSPASVLYRHEEKLLCGPDREKAYLKDLLPAKLDIELNYIGRRTLWTDFAVLGKTLLALFRSSQDLVPFPQGDSRDGTALGPTSSHRDISATDAFDSASEV